MITFVARERLLTIISLWFHNLLYSVVWVTWVYCKVCMIFVVAGRVIRPISFHVFKVNEVRKHEISGFRLIITTHISHTKFIHSKSLSTSDQGKINCAERYVCFLWIWMLFWVFFLKSLKLFWIFPRSTKLSCVEKSNICSYI